jgi:hypothetical protein
MKARLLSFVFIYFSESGLFKGLRAKKIKKIRLRPARAAGCGRPASRLRVCGLHWPGSSLLGIIGLISVLRNEMSANSGSALVSWDESCGP